jgi:hypothetical protein
MKTLDVIYEMVDEEGQFIELYNHLQKLADTHELSSGYKFEVADDSEVELINGVLNLLFKNPHFLVHVKSKNEHELLKKLLHIRKKDTVLLYRLLFVKDPSQINYDDLGDHYSWTSESYKIKDFISYIYGNLHGMEPDNDFTLNDLYLVKIITPTSNIDYASSLWFGLNYGENEVTLQGKENIKVVSVKNIPAPAGTKPT